MIKGSCLCGAITFSISGEITMSRYCHCTHCRKFSGTASAAWGLAKASEFSYRGSRSQIRKYDAGSGSLRVFCQSCGAPMWFEPQALPDYRGIALGAIDEGYPAIPEMHVWTQSSPEWEIIADAIPQHLTHP